MKKRTLALLLAAMMVIACFSGCGSSAASSAAASSAASAEASAASEEAAPAEEAATEEVAPAEAAAPAEEAAPAVEASAAEEAAPAEETAEEVPANELPLTDETVTLTCFANTNSNVTDQIGELGNHQIYIEAEARTGVHIDWQVSMTENASTNFNLMMASGDLTDMIRYGASGYANGLSGALEQEQIIDLTDYMEEYAPSYNYILTNNPSVSLDARNDDGQVLGFYQIYQENGGYDISVTRGPVMRQDLLDDLGVSAPTTLDELDEVLTAFKTEYDLTDPIWIGNSGFSDDSALIGAYGISNSFYQVDGVVKYGPLEDGFKDYLTLMHKWYESGVLNHDFYSYEDNPNSPANEAPKYSGQAGMFYAGCTSLDNYNASPTCEDPDFKLVGVQLVTTDGSMHHFGQDTFAVKPMGCMTVTTCCENPELAVEWCDFWYSEEGNILSNYGIEGLTFEYDENGEPQWTDYITNNPDGISYIVCRQIYLTLTQQPGINNQNTALSQLTDISLEAIDTWCSSCDGAYLISDCYSMTAEENEEISAILSDIDTLNDEVWIKMITGDMSLDDFDGYIDDLYSMNIERAIEIRQAALDRYYAR